MAPFMEGIYLQAMSKSFHDAICVTRKLGIRYIRIDALCIMQDSREDWANEAASMGNYYQNASIVLSIMSAADADCGFIRPRDLRSSISLGSGLRLRRARPSWDEVFRDSSLSNRGWAFQERLLCTGMLHFEQGELFWECLEVSAREGSFVESTGRWSDKEWTQDSLKRCLAFDHISQSKQEPSALTKELLMGHWYRILKHYSTTRLTFQDDIFPAMSGTAQKFGETTRFSYITGLWKEDLYNGLLWYAQAIPSCQEQLATDTIPSWSWAYLHGPKAQLYNPSSSSIESHHMATFGPDPEERQSYTYRGPAVLTAVAGCFTAYCHSIADDKVELADSYLRIVLNIFNKAGAFIGTGYWDKVPDPSPEDMPGSSTTCTAMLVSQRMDPKLGCISYFLLLRKVGDDHYVRIGIGQMADTTYGYATNTLDLASLGLCCFKIK